jgi:hypothetical protein
LLFLSWWLAALPGCAVQPAIPELTPASAAVAAPGGLVLGIRGHAPAARRVAAFAAQVATFDVALTRLETGETTFSMTGLPAKDGLSRLTAHSLEPGRYRIAIAARDAEGHLLNAGGAPEVFFPEGLEVRPNHVVGSQDDPLVCQVTLRPSLAGVTGSAIDLGFDLQDGAVELYGQNAKTDPAGSDAQGAVTFTQAELANSVGEQVLYTAWLQPTAGGSTYMGPATCSLSTSDPSNMNAHTLTITLTDTTAAPPVAREVKLFFFGTQQNPKLNSLVDFGVLPVMQQPLTMFAKGTVKFRRTADPKGANADRYVLKTAGDSPTLVDLVVGDTLAQGDADALLGMILTVPSTTGGDPTVIRLERLSQ